MLEKRPPSGIWGGLWCFPETDADADAVAVCAQRYGARVELREALPVIAHGFTHYHLDILPQPALVKGTVIMSDMAVFQIGPTGLGVVQPYAAGPAADLGAFDREIAHQQGQPLVAAHVAQFGDRRLTFLRALERGIRPDGRVCARGSGRTGFDEFVTHVALRAAEQTRRPPRTPSLPTRTNTR